MAKVLRTLRNHWKKSIFFGGVAAYAINYGKNKFDEKQLMRRYCKEALTYGEPGVPTSFAPYHVTVVLNPAAYGGKGRKRFESYCAPLLNLAGMKVSVIRTEGEGQAKSIVEVMENCDAVLIAGGDGTLMEAVTGCMRRKDKLKIPIGILPVGTDNQMARNLFPSAKFSDVKLMAEATMAVVRQLYLRPIDVIEVENISDDSEIYSGRKIYGLRRIQSGAYRDTESRIARYWFLAGLKKYLMYVFAYTTSAKEIMWSVPSRLESILKFEEPEVVKDFETEHSVSWSDWLRLKVFGAEKKESTLSEIPERAESWETIDDQFTGLELIIQSPNDFPLTSEPSRKVLSLTQGPNDLSFVEFVGEGWRRQRHKPDCTLPEDWPTTQAASFKWIPAEAASESDIGKEEHFNLDNEAIEIRGPMKISILPDQLMMFCSADTYFNYKKPEEKLSQKKWWQSSGFSRNVSPSLTVVKSF